MSEKILLVDDNRTNLRLLQDILENDNFEVITVTNGIEALEIISNVKPAVILLDIMIPGLVGFEACSLLNKEPTLCDIPVIMIADKDDASDLKTAFDLGAFDYIKKPIDEIEVVARVKSALRYKAQQDKLREFAFRDG